MSNPTATPAPPKVLMIDNYDSFTWNVYQYLCKLGAQVHVYRNDQVTIAECLALQPSHVVISPGPGHPRDAAISNHVIRQFAGKIPVLGVCLGEQCMYELYGGIVTYAGEIKHGKTSKITHDGKGVYTGIPQGIEVIRYHSLAGDPKTLPAVLEITSQTESGIVMGVRHKEFTVEGVQFHPESIKSEFGLTMFENFLRLKTGHWATENSSSMSVEKKQSILDKIVAQRLLDVAEAKARIPASSLEAALATAPPAIDFPARLLRSSPMAVIGEIKRASPSKGDIDTTVNAPEQGLLYAQGGAAAISVLTEPKWFKGALEDLAQVRQAVEQLGQDRPALLRKDFIIDPYQVYEARIAGADTLLLIVAILTDEELISLLALSRQLGMEPLVEVNNEEEMRRAVSVGSRVIGVNNRNLHTFSVDMGTTTQLASLVPADVILAALSGIAGYDDVAAYAKSNARAVLVGESLMRSPDKKEFIQQLLGRTEAA